MATQQSWTAWLLDAYANVVSPSPSEPSHASDGDDTTTTSDSQQEASATSASPYGPYVRTGRGGAGNFTWQSQSPASGDSELEAQNPSTLSERRKAAANIEHLDTGTAIKNKASQKPAAQYVRVGRGFVPSNEIQQSPRSASFGIQLPSSPITSSPAKAHPGRGGAGNHAAAAEINEKAVSDKEREREIEAANRREEIEKQIQSTLPAPPDAWLGGRRRSLDPPEGRE